jgi:hypothetical protein
MEKLLHHCYLPLLQHQLATQMTQQLPLLVQRSFPQYVFGIVPDIRILCPVPGQHLYPEKG